MKTFAPLLEVGGLRLARGGRVLAEGVEMAVRGGELWVVEGANGAGKTTLLRRLAGLGGAALGKGGEGGDGRDGSDGGAEDGAVRWRCAGILYLGHKPGLSGLLSPRENLRWYCAARGLVIPDENGAKVIGEKIGNGASGGIAESADKDIAKGESESIEAGAGVASIDGALVWAGLEGFEDVPCCQLSAGQQRRAGLARLVLHAAPLWLLDEPFAALDAEGAERLSAVISERTATGGAVVLTSHRDALLRESARRLRL